MNQASFHRIIGQRCNWTRPCLIAAMASAFLFAGAGKVAAAAINLITGWTEINPVILMLAQSAGGSEPSLETRYEPFGKLLVRELASAPFPHPDRAGGHSYHGEFFSAREHYSDSRVAMFAPTHFRESAKVDFVVHFHGWNNTVAAALEHYQLVEQFCASGKNAILLVPQGPSLAPDSFGGKLEDTNGFTRFMAEAVTNLRTAGVLTHTNSRLGQIILSGHSGGYHVMASILDHGGLTSHIREVWLFDALYGGTENFVAWQNAQSGRLLNIYTDHGGTKEQSENLLTSSKNSGHGVFASEDVAASEEALRTNKLIFLHTDMIHDDVLMKRAAFTEFLKTSCLENR